MFQCRRLRITAAVIALAAFASFAALPGGVGVSDKQGKRIGRRRRGRPVRDDAGGWIRTGSRNCAVRDYADYPGHLGCATKVFSLRHNELSCTGSLSSSTAEWPAYLTSGTPQAGPGVRQKLLGEVNRKGLGDRSPTVGHPLYLFDQTPGVITGENWFEPTLPPWHGTWYLVDPAGSFLSRTALLSSVTIKGKSVLAAYMEDGGGFLLFPVYGYSGASACKTICADTWPPLISQGHPGTSGGAVPGKIGSFTRPDGTEQVTYGGKPLYLDSNEGSGSDRPVRWPKGAVTAPRRRRRTRARSVS